MPTTYLIKDTLLELLIISFFMYSLVTRPFLNTEDSSSSQTWQSPTSVLQSATSKYRVLTLPFFPKPFEIHFIVPVNFIAASFFVISFFTAPDHLVMAGIQF